jgi:hypothetical protein
MPPPEERGDDFELALRQFAGQIGFYLGEVIRRNHGGYGAGPSTKGARVPGLMADSGQLLWPTVRARKRLTNVRENDLWAYFGVLVGSDPLVE